MIPFFNPPTNSSRVVERSPDRLTRSTEGLRCTRTWENFRQQRGQVGRATHNRVSSRTCLRLRDRADARGGGEPQGDLSAGGEGVPRRKLAVAGRSPPSVI